MKLAQYSKEKIIKIGWSQSGGNRDRKYTDLKQLLNWYAWIREGGETKSDPNDGNSNNWIKTWFTKRLCGQLGRDEVENDNSILDKHILKYLWDFQVERLQNLELQEV